MSFKCAYRLETRRIREPEFPYDGNQLSSPEAVENFARPLFDSDTEKMLVLYLNSKNKLIGVQISTGTIDRQAIYPREVIKGAIMASAASVVFVHNHPSGNCDPSPEDKHLTTELKKACALIDLRVLDHIILGERECYSFVRSGIMPS